MNIRLQAQFLPPVRPTAGVTQPPAAAEPVRHATATFSSNVLFFGKVPKATVKLIAIAAREQSA
jgi:hypothetical protein